MTPEEVAALKAERPSKNAVLLVVWEDITSDGGHWHEGRKKEPKPTRCQTVGWPWRWRPHLVIGGSRGERGQANRGGKLRGDRTAIPWGCVTEARWIG